MKNKRKVIFFKNHNALSDFAIHAWRKIAGQAIKKKGFFSVALSGGVTPQHFYRSLAIRGKAFPWGKTHVFIVDERFVAANHSWNNFRMIRRNLLVRLKIPKKNIHPVSLTEKTVHASVRKYANDIRKFFKLSAGAFPALDLIVLSIGEDGHTASLFPVAKNWKAKNRLAIAVSSKRVKFERISLTLPALNHARNIFFLVIGERKVKILKEVLRNRAGIPAAHVRPRQGKVLFLVSPDAEKK